MKNTALMNFSVDKESKKIFVERVIDADVKLVWSAWTESKILDKWWAPKPWKAETKSMDFTEGGYWLYAMIGPGNVKHWSRADFKKIEEEKFYMVDDGFCDEKGKIDRDLPRSNWKVYFNGNGNDTMVKVEISFKELKDLEEMLTMGFKDGFASAMTNLDELLASGK